jgi:ribosomal-protein-alanine N-acetyltransferase
MTSGESQMNPEPTSPGNAGIITTSRLRMRPLSAADVDEMHQLWTDPDVRKYLWDDLVIDRKLAEDVVQASIDLFNSHRLGFWTLGLKDETATIGFCGLRLFGEPPEVEILFALYPAYWGLGLASEAAQSMLRFGFEQTGFDRIYGGADPPNLASFRVMERIGMKYDKRVTINGLEAVYYVVTREDFRPEDLEYAFTPA